MSSATITAGDQDDPHNVGHDSDTGSGVYNPSGSIDGKGGIAPTRIIVGYGFWIFLLSDFIMFAGFFAAYAVLYNETAGGPSGKDLFDLTLVAWETVLLLLSSFACGMAMIAVQVKNMLWTQVSLLVTGLLGAGFLALELYEFSHLIGEGAGPSRSAFLSSFFALVGLHGLHVAVGLLWLGTMMAQLYAKGFRADIDRRLLCFSLFWHALDIVWVALFTTVYLMGMH